MFSLLCLIKHNTQFHARLSHPPPPRLIVEDEETDNKYKDITLHGCDAQGKKGLRVITNKGQIIIPKWSRVQETTY